MQLYAEGREIPLRITGEENGRFEAGEGVEFYGLGLDVASTDARVYWLVVGSTPGQRIPLLAGPPRRATTPAPDRRGRR